MEPPLGGGFLWVVWNKLILVIIGRDHLHVSNAGNIRLQTIVKDDHPVVKNIQSPSLSGVLDGKRPRQSRKSFPTPPRGTSFVGVKVDCVLIVLPLLSDRSLSDIRTRRLLNFGGSSEYLFYVLATSQVTSFSLGEKQHQGDPLVSAEPQQVRGEQSAGVESGVVGSDIT